MKHILDRLRVLPQYLLPQHLVTAAIHRLARCRWRPLKNSLIRLFILVFRVDMSQAEQDSPEDYEHFNAFFTRPIRLELRPVAEDRNIICSPVDGAISQIGAIESGSILQAKNSYYTLDKLLADSTVPKTALTNGSFATLYLSPGDYHRVHMPCNGRLQCMTYVPGDLFAVNAHTARIVNNLFARNERVISVFETDHGPMALIMVGAVLVGSMETVWEGVITPAARRKVETKIYPDGPYLQRGAEMGRFNMGSTVILLFPGNTVRWESAKQAGEPVLMGEPIGSFTG